MSINLNTEITDEMINTVLPHLVGISGSKIRPVGYFIPGYTADESEDWNWRHCGRERVRRALQAVFELMDRSSMGEQSLDKA